MQFCRWRCWMPAKKIKTRAKQGCRNFRDGINWPRLCYKVAVFPGVSAEKREQQSEQTMASVLSESDEAQLTQTIEMFEVITQSQPQDYQSLEILKEAYAKLGRDKDVVGTSKRIAN